MPNFLVLDNRIGSGGACVAYTYNNGSPTQLGDPFGTVFVNTYNYGRLRNQIIQFAGQIYAVARNGIYQKDDPTSQTGPWSQVLAFTSPSTTTENYSGIHVADIGGVQHLFGVFGSDNLRFRWFKFDGTTWTQAPAQVDPGTPAGFTIGDVVVWRNVLYMTLQNGRYTLSFDPGSESFNGSIVPQFDGGDNSTSFCVAWDRLFAYSRNAATSRWYLHELIGSTWTTVGAQGNFSAGTTQNGKCCVFTDGTYLYWLQPLDSGTSGSDGWYSRRLTEAQIDSAAAGTNLNGEALPLSFVAPNAGGTWTGNILNESFEAVYDTSEDPLNPTIYLFYSSSLTAGTNYTVYRWNYDPVANPPPNAANLMSSVDTGGNVYHALPTGFASFGERVFNPGELDIRIVGRASEPGGERISFIAYGGGTGRKMKLFYALDGTPPLVEATLVDGSVLGGTATFNSGLNQVEGIDADGVTVYSVLWGAEVDGLPTGRRVIRVPQIAA